jgi:hypothetical protein
MLVGDINNYYSNFILNGIKVAIPHCERNKFEYSNRNFKQRLRLLREKSFDGDTIWLPAGR